MRTPALLAALLLAGCPSTEPDPAPVTTFGNGFSVEEADGGWILSRDGRRLVAGNPGTGPRVATFDLSYSGGFGGIWEFEEEGRVERTFGSLDEVTIVGDRATLTFSDGSDTASLVIRAVGPERVALTVSTDVTHDAIALPFACDDGASFHGFGEQYNGTDQRGETFDLFLSEQGIGRDPTDPPQPINGDEHTTYFPMPYFVDPRGVGFQPWASRFFFMRAQQRSTATWISGISRSGRAFTNFEQSSSLFERLAARILSCSSSVKFVQV